MGEGWQGWADPDTVLLVRCLIVVLGEERILEERGERKREARERVGEGGRDGREGGRGRLRERERERERENELENLIFQGLV